LSRCLLLIPDADWSSAPSSPSSRG
jgi:hypothetical protein